MYIMGYTGIQCVNKESGAAINGEFTCDSSIMSAYRDAEKSQTVQETKGVFGLRGKEGGGWWGGEGASAQLDCGEETKHKRLTWGWGVIQNLKGSKNKGKAPGNQNDERARQTRTIRNGIN